MKDYISLEKKRRGKYKKTMTEKKHWDLE